MKRSASLFLLILVSNCGILFAQRPLAFRDTSIKGGQDFAMIIGISKYKFIRPLNYADKDADLFADFLRSPAGGRLKQDNIFKLTNEEATAMNFWSKGFQWLKAKQLQKGDRLYIYLAGHGDAIDEDQFFFLGYDCNPGSDKDNYLISGAIQLYNLKKKIANETSKGVEVFFIMDACRSNELPGGSAGQNFLNTAVSQKKAGEVMMLAAAAGQESLEDASIGNGHGLFTYYLVDGLSGVADADGKPDGRVTFTELKTYVDKYVPTIAKQRFKREQVPYFCCDEFSDKVISTVDPTYLQQWMKTRQPSGRNSFFGTVGGGKIKETADTALLETYNRFYREIRNKNVWGSNSAESWFRQLERKFPNNPYTLDARSTLAAEYLNDAEKKLNSYIGCVLPNSAKDKQEMKEAGDRLETAIGWLKEDDVDNANSLLGRMFLLKSMGDYGSSREAFEYAYACKKLDPGAAYINNWLARLHLADKNMDSARYYAQKAVARAPNWGCALNTLLLIQDLTSKEDLPKPRIKEKHPKSTFGFTAGIGFNQSRPDFQPRGNTTVTGASTRSGILLNAGIIYDIPFNQHLAIRPSVLFTYGNTPILFDIRNATGGITESRIDVKFSSMRIALPLLVKIPGKNSVPYFLLGPSFDFVMHQDTASGARLPVKNSLFLASAAVGIDLPLRGSGLILAPEVRFSQGISDMKESASTNYSNSLGALKKQEWSFGFVLRKR